MTVRVACEFCGKQLRLREHLAGRRIRCPDCGTAINVPGSNEVVGAELYESDPDQDDYGWAETPDDDRGPCPACGEFIIRTAAKCRFCGEIFDQKLRKKQKAATVAADEKMNGGDWVVAILCSGIGCIAGIVWMIQGKPKGIRMFLVSLGVQLIILILQVLIEAVRNPQQF